jgi:hypothetical protein
VTALARAFEPKRIVTALVVIFVLISAADLVVPGRTFMPDENRFLAEAKVMAEEGRFVVFENYRAWEMPLVAIVYAPLYKISGGGAMFIKLARVFQAFLLVLTAVGAASIALSIFGNRLTALIVLFSVTIYPSFLAYQCLLLSETLYTFLLVWGTAALYRWRGGAAALAAPVCVFALSVYARAVLTFMTPVLVVARSLAVTGKPDRVIRVAKYFAMSCALFAVCMSPWWARNWLVFGRFVPFTTSASWNLYLGNNPGNANAGVDWSEDVDRKTADRIFSLRDELLMDKAFMTEGRVYIMGNKSVFLRNSWLKFKRFWNVFLNADVEKLPRYFKYYNWASFVSWGLAFPLALVSLWVNRKEWLLMLPIFALIAYHTFIHVVVISSLRYRLPIEPFFLILGADCLRRFYEERMPVE